LFWEIAAFVAIDQTTTAQCFQLAICKREHLIKGSTSAIVLKARSGHRFLNNMAQLPPPAADILRPAAALAAPLPPVGAPPINAVTTYRQLLSDQTRDAVHGQPGAYLAGYRFEGGAQPVPAPAALRDQTVPMCDRQPMAFLCLVPRLDGTAEVRILHRFMRYLELPGEVATGFHDRVLGLLGDVRPNQIPVVDVPANILHLATTGVRVPTAATMDDVVAAWGEGPTFLGPYTEGDPNTEMVRPRNIQLLPSRYAAMLVHREHISPRTAYRELAGALQADGNLAACGDVMAWLRVACTCRGGGGPQANIPIVLATLPPVHLPEAVYDYVNSKVTADLPALRNPAEAPGSAGDTGHLVEVVRALTGRGLTTGDDRPPKGIAEAYKETYPVLLRYNRVDGADEVAPVWRRLANAHKSEHQTILQQEFAKVCSNRGLAAELYCPVVTTGLKQMVTSFNFAGVGPDDLATGCNPFQVTYTGASDYYAAQATAGVAQQLEQGTSNANLSDIQAIKDKEKVRFPKDMHQVGITLQRYAVLVQTLFQGATAAVHPFVRAVWELTTGFQNRLPFIMDRHQGLGLGSALYQAYPSRILRTVQIQGYEYFQRVSASYEDGFRAVDDVPEFAPLLQDLQRGTYHTSNGWMSLPSMYLQGPVALPSQGAGSAATSLTSAPTVDSSASVVSALTSASTLGGAATRATQTRQPNEAQDPEFVALNLRGGLGPFLRTNRPPRNDAGHEFCVSWWCKGGCYTACGRRAAHVPFASDAERTRLMVFARAHLVLPGE
jgi:hypothetical protein